MCYWPRARLRGLKMARYWPSCFLCFNGLRWSCGKKKMEKRMWPISSHHDWKNWANRGFIINGQKETFFLRDQHWKSQRGQDGPILRTRVAYQNARFVSSCPPADSALYKGIMPYFMAFLLPRSTHHCLDLFNSVFLFAAFLNFATLQLFFNLYRALPASLSPMVRLLFWPLEISSLK